MSTYKVKPKLANANPLDKFYKVLAPKLTFVTILFILIFVIFMITFFAELSKS